MADPRTHLEKMGRELKCPICLSLLKSAVSLTCNHVFCNLCIAKSMKSDSTCPVCKVPYHRREVRPAPHMDNLVNIYKSMEVASGINIFITQNEPSTKSSDKERPVENPISEQVIAQGCPDRAENQGTSKSKGLRRITKSAPKHSDHTAVKPSFPNKKRVHVAHYPLPETPMQPAKFEGGLIKNTCDGLNDSSVVLKENSILNETGPGRSPFFWLRDEEDLEKSTQHTDGDIYTTPPTVPSFSDMKDSDDKISPELSQPVEGHSKPDGVDFFDSEMFEWTQRACSPELLLTPVKMQVADSEEDNDNNDEKLQAGLQDANTNEGLCNENTNCVNPDRGKGLMDDMHPNLSSPRNINTNNQIINGKLNKRVRKAKDIVKKKCTKKDADKASGTHVDSKEVSINYVQKQTNDTGGSSLILEKTRKRSKKVNSVASATQPSLVNVLTLPVRAETLDQCGKNMVSELPASLDKKQGSDEDLHLKKTRKRSKKVGSGASTTELGPDNVRTLPVRAETVDQGGKNMVSELPASIDKKQGSDEDLHLKKSRKRSKKVGRGASATELSPDNVLTSSVRAKTLDQGGKNMVSELHASLDKKQGSDEDLHLNKTRKNGQKVNNHCEDDYSLRSKRRKMGSTEANMLEKVCAVQNQTDEDTIPQSSFFCLTDDTKTSDLKGKPSKDARKIKSSLNSKCNAELRCSKRMKVSFNGILRDELDENNQEGHNIVVAKETLSTGKVQGSAEVRVINDSSRVKKLHQTQGVTLRKCETPVNNKVQCSFCHSSEDSKATGEMVHYCDGRPVAADYNGESKIIHSHRHCTEWAPNVYFEDDTAINLEAELARSRRIKCCCCDLKGASLGCYEKSCRRSFHVPCAKSISQCRWDNDNFVMLCPLHASSKLPNEESGPQESRKKRLSKVQLHTQCNEVSNKNDIGKICSWNSPQNKLVLCCSALTAGERDIVSEFERLSKVPVLKKWDSSVTHVIASTDENGACRRTLKYLMAILEGKWILNIEWVKACMKDMKPVNEEQYEITVDIHGIRDGPRFGRLRVLNKQSKLFDGMKFYLMGGFVPSYKGYLQDLVIAAGGTILHRKPISSDQETMLSGSSTSSTFIIYSIELPDKCDLSKKDMILNSRRSDAEVLASSTAAKAVSNSWVLNSIAASKLQSYVE